MDELGERKEKILNAIIQNYLETGEPVGSRTISKMSDLNLSSATIRNEMSDLEELGYIVQPHTSSGRIPSDKGYRFYVDHLMEVKDREVTEMKDLMIDNDDRYQMVIVGGSAFILLGKLTRATHDIDALSVPKELYGLLGKYDINTDVEAYIDNFPYNFQDRLQPLPFGGTKVQFYTPSLEDLVIAKLCSFRDTDKADVESEAVRNSLDWNLLEHLATDEDELRASILNDWRYRDFYIRYQEYVERWRP